ncbi:MAG: hypothetical protein JWL91_1656 [Sphingomonas bacterium]|jgi:hypothetical protein|nr:hypothetical protein [Sphingomonas bacterium]MDB5689780.1 hypothetical protein [Sphingomonas bacterium]
MKRLAYAAVITAVVAAAPAIALPNAFWTFGWDFPSADKPWTIGGAAEQGDVRLAAQSPAYQPPAAALEAPAMTLSEATTLPEPDPVAAAVALVAAMPDEPTLSTLSILVQVADATPAGMPATLLAYDLAGL